MEDFEEMKARKNSYRVDLAVRMLANKGYAPVVIGDKEINFILNGHVIKYFPYRGWFQGKGLKAGRGIKNLIKQLDEF